MKTYHHIAWACAGWLLVLASCGAENEPPTGVGDELALNGGAGSTAFALTDEGLVRGFKTATTREFLGIPYAAAPVGDLRWRPPRAHAHWRTPLDATQFGDHCSQVASPFGLASATEDCLFLNVFTPRHTQGRAGLHPVMVWLHGGALIVGESDDYDPTKLIEGGDVIVVTINYRLGALGFLAHPALTAESPDHASGNYGLMDQQAALAWVQRNILFFGGDPSRVTIFGESAGGLSVHAQLASPLATHLYSRAIVESGAYQLTQPTLAAGEAAGTAFATRAGCPDQSAACLRALPVATILANQGNGAGAASPVIDGKVLTQSVQSAFAGGTFHRVPIIEGANHDEWRLFVALTNELVSGPVTAAGYPAAIQGTLGIPAALVPLFVTEYPLSDYPSPGLALAALGTDGIFTCNARHVEQLVSQFVPTFAYEFNDENAPELFLPPVSFSYGAAHASEIQYLFDLRATVPAPPLDADQERLSQAMISYWTTFARTGQPSSPAEPAWPSYSAASDDMLSLVPPEPGVETSFAAAHKCAFWDALRR
jgi:para-nitrobenzyl esterase